MKKLFCAALLFGSILALGACSGNSAKKENTTSPTEATAEQAKTIEAKDLQGEWTISAVNGVSIVQDEETPFLGFNMTENRLYGMTGCNRVMGTLVLNASQPYALSFDQMGSTKMMCHNDSLEQAILLALSEVKSFGALTCKDQNQTCIGLFNADQKELLLLQKKLTAEKEAQEIPN